MPVAEAMNGGGEIEDVAVVEMVGPTSSSTITAADAESSSISICDDDDDDQIAPLLTQSVRPKINIFTLSYPRNNMPTKDEVIRGGDPDKSPILQFIFWLWSGSRYSGLLCMVFSSIIYSTMEVMSDVFTAQSMPLFEIVFARCTVVLILSFVWLRRSGQPIFGPNSVRKLLVLRALAGYISVLSFIYSIQRLPVSQAVTLSFAAPIMASVVARITLHEKLKIAEIGGLASSFFGVLFIFQPMGITQGVLQNALQTSEPHSKGFRHIFAVLVGLVSSISCGITYCLTRAGARAADQPVLPVFSFGLLVSPAAAISTFAFENIVLPSFYSFLLMVVLGVLAFSAEITLARALQLEKTARVANIQFIEAALSQFLGMGSSRIIPSFGRLVGCIVILISACCTMYIGPEKEIEQEA